MASCSYKPVSRWTRKRRNDSDLRCVLDELHDCDPEPSTSSEISKGETAAQISDFGVTTKQKQYSTESEGELEYRSDFDSELEQNFKDDFESQLLRPPACEVSDSDSESSTADDENLLDDLGDWALRYNIPHVAVTALLGILRKSIPSLPKDSRTVLNTDAVNSAVVTKNVAGGSYYHFGLETGIISVISAFGLNSTEPIRLVINIDGLPLYRSTAAQFWPILGMVANCNYSEPFVVGLFCGNSKPSDISEYMSDFVREFQALLGSGIVCENKKYKISLSSVVCDTPARAFAKNVKGHTGYFGCDKCSQEGEYVNGRMTFPEVTAHLRTDESFRAMANDEHHLGSTPFTDLPLNMISGFPLDYMHLVCLGVVRKLLYLWLKGPLEIRLGRHTVRSMSERLTLYSSQVPMEFGRKPRSLDYLDRWKATELRQFLLYTGMFCMRDLVDDSLYNNFMLLSVAMSILLSPHLCQKHCDYAGELLRIFVSNFGAIYGKQYVTYNVHSTVHLADEAKVHGPLDNIAGFAFENCLGKLKKLIRKPHAPLQQAVRRLSERRMVTQPVAVDVLQREHSTGPVPLGFGSCVQYKQYRHRDYCITLSEKDNCVLIGRSVGIVCNFLAVGMDKFVVYQKFAKLKSCYTYPVDSTQFEVYSVARLDSDLLVAPLTDIRKKCVILCSAGSTFIVPFVH